VQEYTSDAHPSERSVARATSGRGIDTLCLVAPTGSIDTAAEHTGDGGEPVIRMRRRVSTPGVLSGRCDEEPVSPEVPAGAVSVAAEGVARAASIGTILTSMQLALAVRTRVLIPWHTGEPEGWKTADRLLTVDKGGLSFQSPVRAFEPVAERDFSAMYPTIMVAHNVSAETLFCGCCTNQAVPEAGYAVCTRRRGLIPALFTPLIARLL
jgi:hypothetical protein